VTSSGECRCGRWVANAQYLQCELHVRDNDRVTLREKVTRRRTGESLRVGHILARLPMAARLARLLVVLLAALLAGCGGDDDPAGTTTPAEPPIDATLLLDFAPNAVHSGIYAATRRGLDRKAGIDLRVQAPTASTDAVRLLLGGRAQLAVLDIHDLAIARERGRDLVGVMALVQRPLAAVLADASVRRPRDLEGRRVGVTGLPSDDAVLQSIVRGDGGDPAGVRSTTIGFNAVASVVSGRVAGATAFWNVEGVALHERMPDAREFRVDDFGAPAYPELVVTVARRTLQQDPDLVRRAVHALVSGYEVVDRDPEGALRDLVASAPDVDPTEAQRQLDALGDAFGSGDGIGALDPQQLRAWAAWEVRFGIVKRRPDVDAAFDASFLPGS
jgi:putative hydroxymethylpyrimidine transport system substrate-binding protein